MNILSVTGGAVASVFVFLTCFALVILFRYAKAGYLNSKKTPPREEEKKPGDAPEPIYYIVERKSTKNPGEYSDPKEIKFK